MKFLIKKMNFHSFPHVELQSVSSLQWVLCTSVVVACLYAEVPSTSEKGKILNLLHVLNTLTKRHKKRHSHQSTN